jgi:hypothetical protein
VAQAVKGVESHGTPAGFATQVQVNQLKEHGSDPKSHGDKDVSFPSLNAGKARPSVHFVD